MGIVMHIYQSRVCRTYNTLPSQYSSIIRIVTYRHIMLRNYYGDYHTTVTTVIYPSPHY